MSYKMWNACFIRLSYGCKRQNPYKLEHEGFRREGKVEVFFFANNKARVCLTTDTWTSIQRTNYMCVTAHFIDDDWVLHKRVINFKPVYSHKGEEIGKVLL